MKTGETKAASGPPWLVPRAAYIHVPFCAHHCGYCDFAVAVGKDNLVEMYLEALAVELSCLEQPRPIETLYIGGGTPTYLSAGQLGKLLSNLLHWLPLMPGHEFSIEANPGTLTSEKVAVLADHGVNRVSLGAQSFHPHLLQTLERDHKPDDVPRAVAAIRARIPLVALDLIFGVPGQTIGEWEFDLGQALARSPDHVSTYGLTYEKGTRLWKEREQGRVKPLAEEDELAMYARAIDILESAGFEHYEISNFARPGRRSRHNQVYWANEAYFGFGMGAARYINGVREVNTRELQGYLRRVLSEESPVFQREELSPPDRARETLVIGLRRSDGIRRQAFQKQTGFELDSLVQQPLRHLTMNGLLHDNGECVSLTRQGKYVADAVIEELLKG